MIQFSPSFLFGYKTIRIMTTKELKLIKDFIDLMNEKHPELDKRSYSTPTQDEQDLKYHIKEAKKNAIQVIRIVKTPL